MLERDLGTLARLWFKGFPRKVPKYALIPGDPRRIPLILQEMEEHKALEESEMHSKVHLASTQGVDVLVTATGVGCPAAAICVELLSALGVQCFIRVGSAGGTQEDVDIGDIVIATAAIRNEGTTRAYVPLEFPAVASPRVVAALTDAAQKLGIRHHVGVVRTGDALFAGAKATDYFNWKEYFSLVHSFGAVASEMECAAVFTVASLRGKLAGAVLAIDGNAITGKSIPRWSGKIDPLMTKRYKEGQQKAAKTAVEAVLILEKKA